MINVDLQQLIRALDAETRRDWKVLPNAASPVAAARSSSKTCYWACWSVRKACSPGRCRMPKWTLAS